jgi:hypothetical protein
MQRRTLLSTLTALGISASLVFAVQAQPVPRIAVTDLAYTQAVSQYFEAATFKGKQPVSGQPF